jgi:thiamine-phosphate pyrophosphorylase
VKRIGALHVITDSALQSRFTHRELAEMAIAGGADTIQFRQKTGTARELLEIARQMRKVCVSHGVPLIVNDRADVAMAAGADGVHLGQDDLPVAAGRRLLPQGIVGASARTEEKILEAIREGADYIGFGPIYRTSSKPDAEAPKGLEALRRMCAAATCPVIAVGGITVERVREVIQAGAHGVAVISAVCAEEDPTGAARRIRQEIDRFRR